MANSKTKRTLLVSSVSLLLSFAMLLGTTFAWFTDSVTSANNIITSGNLDVKLYYLNDEVTTWAEVGANTNVFKADTLWEPGHVEVVELKVVNAGSLALKYQLGVNVASETGSVNVDGKEFKLSDYIKYGIVDGEFTGNREAAVAAVEGSAAALNEAYASDIIELLKGAEKIVTMVVYMPETVGNEANHAEGRAVPTINLGINLAATQLNSEEDSFGSDYDKDAEVPDVTVFNAADIQGALDKAAAGEKTVIALADDIKGAVTYTAKANTEVVIDGNGNAIEGGILLDGKSGTIQSAGILIQDVVFDDASAIVGDACIRLGDGENTSTRYVCNVTIKDCTFDAEGKVGVKSYTGGDKNVQIIGCTATANAHSLAQLKGVDGVLIENCTVNAVRGINFNNSLNVVVNSCVIDVQKYAVRFGESDNDVVESYAVTNCTLTSENVDGDAAVVLRAGATNAELDLTGTTINATIQMTGHENAKITK